MKLAEWEAANPTITTLHGAGGLVTIHDDARGEARTQLWKLDDYIVSSVSAGVVRLLFVAGDTSGAT